MKFKLLTTTLLFLSSLPQAIQAAPINDECITLPRPDQQECTNDPLLTTSYEMDYMNFSYAWDKSYGTARVGIVDSMTHIFSLDQGPGKIRSHDTGQYACIINGIAYIQALTGLSSCNTTGEDVYYPFTFHVENEPSLHGDLILSLFASTANDGRGMSSICRDCSIAYNAYDTVSPGGDAPSSQNYLDFSIYMNTKNTRGYRAMANSIYRGDQIVNLSGYFGANGTASSATFPNCEQQMQNGYQQSLCQNLKDAKELDTIIVASTGNNPSFGPNWPAKETEMVIGVGGTDINGNIWRENTCPFGNDTEECGSQYFTNQTTIMAPAKNIASYHHNIAYNPGLGCFNINGDGYTRCSGTSFAAPIISGLAAIMRSLNPLLSFDEVKHLLQTSRVQTDSQGRTYSIPNIQPITKKKIMGKINGITIQNRLKPMFRLHHTYNYQGEPKVDYLSTTIPQVASAAWRRQYLSEVDKSSGYLQAGLTYRTDNTEPLALGYPRFRQPNMNNYGDNARAPFYIFGGHENPFTGADDMVPLYHFALKTVDTNDPRCYDRADHAYGTFHVTAFSQRINVRCNHGVDTRYVKEGIEGYLLPNCPEGPNGCYENTGNANAPQCLMLRYSDVDNSYALLMESELNKAKFSTYTGAADHLIFMDDAECLGYAYPNVDSDNDLVLDGMEIILGTDPFDSDSDNDGLLDGEEYPPTSPIVSDPLVVN